MKSEKERDMEQRLKRVLSLHRNDEIIADDVRILPIPLEQRRQQLRQQQRQLKKHQVRDSSSTRRRRRIFKTPFSNSRFSDSRLDYIESRYGSSIVSVFKFMKWITVLNGFNSLIVIGLIFIPQTILKNESSDIEDYCTEFTNGFVPIENASVCCTRRYEFNKTRTNFDDDIWTRSWSMIRNVLLGDGWFSYSPVFYGYYYYDGYNNNNNNNPGPYDMSLAYFVVIITILTINLIVIVIGSTRSFQPNLSDIIINRSDLVYLLMGTWNYNVSSETRIRNRQFYISTRLKERRTIFKPFYQTNVTRNKPVSNDDDDNDNIRRLRRRRKIVLWIQRLIINGTILGILGIFGYEIYYVTTILTPYYYNDRFSCSSTSSMEKTLTTRMFCFGIEYLSAIFITLCNVVLPFLFDKLIVLERYDSKTTKLILHLGRLILLRLSSLIVTFWSLYDTVSCEYVRGCGSRIDGTTIFINDSDSISCSSKNLVPVQTCDNNGYSSTISTCDKKLCWETYIGQQFYKLAIMNISLQVLLVFLFDYPRSRFFKISVLNTIEFNVPKHVLDIVYSQTICWLGIFYCPFITLLTVISNVMIYYLRLFFVLKVCTPSPIPYSTERASALFKYFLLISFLCCTVAVGITIASVQPSAGCGPFRNIVCQQQGQPCLVYDYIINIILQQHKIMQNILFFLSDSWVLSSIAGALCLILYLSYAEMNANRRLFIQINKVFDDISHETYHLIQKIQKTTAADNV